MPSPNTVLRRGLVPACATPLLPRETEARGARGHQPHSPHSGPCLAGQLTKFWPNGDQIPTRPRLLLGGLSGPQPPPVPPFGDGLSPHCWGHKSGLCGHSGVRPGGITGPPQVSSLGPLAATPSRQPCPRALGRTLGQVRAHSPEGCGHPALSRRPLPIPAASPSRWPQSPPRSLGNSQRRKEGSRTAQLRDSAGPQTQGSPFPAQQGLMKHLPMQVE